ncbi:peptidoglycan-binding domain-containing protein [Streptomyces sp. H27-D2]|uniref:peptidoglycan-binding domain-containing protein n=1 Tax=Streptomyces sp. H27-D2 TaxID=3046304 RepID=UPI002DB970EC|nr:peptidoglycan-binding domain-containing protein [Streptomyces sp. H27-D2]MEC4016315.1 peptidoglycan-binding domain-containing protein [Streptomyces sp. H27-D2]
MTTSDGTDELHRQPGASSGALEVHGPSEVSSETSVESSGALAATSADGGESVVPPESGRRRRPLRTSLIVTVAIAVAAAAGIAATGTFGGDDTSSTSAAPAGPSATAKVKRTTLSSTETVDGNLGYGDESTVQAPASSGTGGGGSGESAQNGQPAQNDGAADSGSSGIITWLPDGGDTITRGKPVYKVNQQKVPLLYGSTPFYRTLKQGSEGADVKTLEQNLSELGYDGFTVDDEYTYSTAQAVKDWQDDLGRDQTGTVRPGDAVVASGARRVAEVKTAPGAQLSGALLTWTGTERLIAVDLDVEYEDTVKKGTKATVTLPDNTEVEAEVTDVGTPTTPKSDGSSDSSSDSSKDSQQATLPVELKVKDQKSLGRYQAAAVDVELKDKTRKDVLAVPVNALVAQRGGGYAVEAVTSKGSEYRPVKVGMFADSLVEVSGDGITEGLVVGVPK